MPTRKITKLDSDALQSIADFIVEKRRIIMITGAGISTSCGIPDFRSKKGLYNLLVSQDTSLLPIAKASRDRPNALTPLTIKGEDLFSCDVFDRNETTITYYQFIANLRLKILDVKDTSHVHHFLRKLRDGHRLQRCYTQNIDGLEGRDGLDLDLEKKHDVTGDKDGLNLSCDVVQLHGTILKLRCHICFVECDWSDEATDTFLTGTAPGCAHCLQSSDQRQALGKRRLPIGSLRPDIVLYGQQHPHTDMQSSIIQTDIEASPDMLIIMGTSLKVNGVQALIRDIAKVVHQEEGGRVIMINHTQPSPSTWDKIIDDFITMDCDEWILDLQKRRTDIWDVVDTSLEDESAVETVPPLEDSNAQDREDRMWLDVFFG